MSNESITKTFGVAAALCVVCAIIVSLSDVALKDVQTRNKALDKQINILRAAGLVEPSAKVNAAQASELFANAKVAVVDMATGDVVEEKSALEADSISFDKNDVIALDKADDVAKIKSIPAKGLVYMFYDENGALKTAVLPIVGTGLWSTMYGFLALDGDLETVAHIVFYAHGETPGLGGEISNPKWTEKWEGKKAVDENGTPVVKVIKGAVDASSPDADCEIDGISGATLTGNGVNSTVAFWLGEKGFGPFLKKAKGQTRPTNLKRAKTERTHAMKISENSKN